VQIDIFYLPIESMSFAPLFIETAQTGMHFGFKQQIWFSIID
jgi:hypothetical protein